MHELIKNTLIVFATLVKPLADKPESPLDDFTTGNLKYSSNVRKVEALPSVATFLFNIQVP